MSELLEQFLVEARELVDQATADLLALEQNPRDRDRLNGAFRAFHTLKGSAGIVEFPAMVRALHAAEDALAGLRSGGRDPGPKLFSDCLACLDQVGRWLDHVEAHGELPPGLEAEASADALLGGFAPQGGKDEPVAGASRTDPAPEGWLEDLLARHPDKVAKAAAAIRYAPDAECFFRGEDPLAMLADLPGLLAMEIGPAGYRPAPETLDPYACWTWFSALLAAPPEELAGRLNALGRQVEVRRLSAGRDAHPAEVLLPDAARSLLQAQVDLLHEEGAEGAAGRLGSAGRVAANVLRHCGMTAEGARIERVSAESQAAADPRRLSAAIEACLRGETADEPSKGVPADVPHVAEQAVRTLRVDAGRVDELVKLTGEFTVEANALAHAAALARDGTDAATLAALLQDQHTRFQRLLGEMQRSVLDLRVLPMRHVFQRFPRLVREIAAGLGKPVRLVMEGEDTEADKLIAEGLSEPMLHLVRNAIDHGAETAAERAAAGKPAIATIRLRASRVGEHVVVEVEDDGRGIEDAAIRRAAAERQIASADELSGMSDQGLLDLVFAPGLSTAETTTELSGRGIGMDAVRTAVEQLGGRVDLDTRPGHGTTIRLTLPFTVMMTPVMTVEAGGQVFGIPLDTVVETLRVPRARITAVGAAHAFVLRDRTIPLIDLARELGEKEAEAPDSMATVVVADIGGALTGLEVERLGTRMDVMLRPMDGLLAGVRGIAGTTLLGDGRVLIVVDLQDLS